MNTPSSGPSPMCSSRTEANASANDDPVRVTMGSEVPILPEGRGREEVEWSGVKELEGGGRGKRSGYGTSLPSGMSDVGVLGGRYVSDSFKRKKSLTALFSLAKEPQRDSTLSHDSAMMSPRCELLSDVAALLEVHAVHKVDIAFERKRWPVGRTLGNGERESMEMVVRGRYAFEESFRSWYHSQYRSCSQTAPDIPAVSTAPAHLHPIPGARGSSPAPASFSHLVAASSSSAVLSSPLGHAAKIPASVSTSFPSLTLDRRIWRLR